MLPDNLVKCPLCGAFTHIDKAELLAVLRDSKIRQQLENYVAELLRLPVGELAVVAAGQREGRDFNKDVHSWNPNVPICRRSPKE